MARAMHFVDMAKTPIEVKEEMADRMAMPSMGDIQKYPYGLSLSLCGDELDKLDMDADCEVGDYVHIHALAKVTSVSSNETENGKNSRVELQITHMEVESEDEEDDEADDEMSDDDQEDDGE